MLLPTLFLPPRFTFLPVFPSEIPSIPQDLPQKVPPLEFSVMLTDLMLTFLCLSSRVCLLWY